MVNRQAQATAPVAEPECERAPHRPLDEVERQPALSANRWQRRKDDLVVRHRGQVHDHQRGTSIATPVPVRPMGRTGTEVTPIQNTQESKPRSQSQKTAVPDNRSQQRLHGGQRGVLRRIKSEVLEQTFDRRALCRPQCIQPVKMALLAACRIRTHGLYARPGRQDVAGTLKPGSGFFSFSTRYCVTPSAIML